MTLLPILAFAWLYVAGAFIMLVSGYALVESPRPVRFALCIVFWPFSVLLLVVYVARPEHSEHSRAKVFG